MGCEKKIIIGITGINPFIGNRGVGALALSTLNLLQNLSKEKNLNLELVMINYNSGNYVIDVGENHIKTRAILPVSFFNLKSIFRMLVNPNRIFFFLKYLKIDLFLCMGEGDSFSDIYGKGRFKYINNQHRMARLLGKKYVLLPQTIGPFQDSNVKKQ
jgi:polysaccharide pyruvyl transferase WcaK-like protein